MRRPVVLTLAIVIVLLVAASGVLFQKYQKKTVDFTNMKTAEETASARYAEAFNSIVEIQDSLNAIALSDTSVRLLSRELQTEQSLQQTRGRQALDRIGVIKASLQRTRDRIHRLEAGLRKNGVRIVGLERMIADLKRTVSEKEEIVTQLSGRVDSLQTTVSGLQVTVQEGQDTIRTQRQNLEDKRRTLATVYYVIGTKKDLTASGVIVAKGGVLGLGKTLVPSGHFNESLFRPLDTDEESVVRTGAAKVQVVSAQPAGSYELEVVGGQVELHILNPGAFRQVKHLVIMRT
jgi:hypothetical protein